jgi:hypothetical protein
MDYVDKWDLVLLRKPGLQVLTALSRMRAIPKSATRDDPSRDPIFCQLQRELFFSRLSFGSISAITT